MTTPKQHHDRLMIERKSRLAGGEPLGNLQHFGQPLPIKARWYWRYRRTLALVGRTLSRRRSLHELRSEYAEPSPFFTQRSKQQLEQLRERNARVSGLPPFEAQVDAARKGHRTALDKLADL